MIRQGGLANVDVDCVIPASATAVVSVAPVAAVSGVAHSAPSGFGIRFAGPSPFVAGSASPLHIAFALQAASAARLEVLDITGRRVAMLLDSALGAGAHDATWDGRGPFGGTLAPGVYLVRLSTARERSVTRIALIR